MQDILTGLVWIGLVVQAYHYIGYLALLALAAWCLPRPVRKASMPPAVLPRISLIISAFNESSVIRQKLENSLTLDYPSLEIIVNSEGSSDDTPQVVASFAHKGVRGLYEPKRRGKSAAMNAAVAVATGELLVFSDANAYYDSQALRYLAENFQDSDVGLVTGVKSVRARETAGAGPAASEGLYWRYENLIKALETASGSTVAVHGEMMAVRRSQFKPVPEDLPLDDAYLGLVNLRSGHRVVFEPRALCWENASLSLKDDHTRRSRCVAGRYSLLSYGALWPVQDALTMWKLLSHKVLRLLLPVFAVVALAANLVALLLPNPHWTLWWTAAGQLGFCTLAAMGLAGGSVAGYLPATRICAFLLSGYYSNIVGLWRFLTGRQGVLWERVAR